MVGAESICTGSMISPSLSALMTQEIDPIVKIWLGFGEDEEPAKCTILFVMKTARTAPTWRANCRRNIVDSPPKGIPTLWRNDSCAPYYTVE